MKRTLVMTYILCVLLYAGLAGAEKEATVTPTFSSGTAAPRAPAPAPPQVLEVVPPAASPQLDPPPTWLKDVLLSIKALPIVGPIATLVLQWLGVIATILTALVAFLLVSIRALSTVLVSAKMLGIAGKLISFQDGKIMYWLKYFSMFNAQKPESKDDERSAA